MVLNQFFNVPKPADVRWAHGVNSLDDLNEVLSRRDDIDMVEADVRLSSKDPKLVVVSHDVADYDVSDNNHSFEAWIRWDLFRSIVWYFLTSELKML